jgi:5'(3')-deoxyribonucleotidase
MLYLVDMDGVITDFVGAVCEEHNDNVRPEDITKWDLSEFGIKNETWQKPGFFRNLKPFAGAVETLWKMHQLGDKLWIVTNAMGIDYIEEEKAAWVREHIPFVRGIVFTDQKHTVPGDVLIDDSPEFLNSYPGTTIKINHPYNVDVEADYAFDSLADAAKQIC